MWSYFITFLWYEHDESYTKITNKQTIQVVMSETCLEVTATVIYPIITIPNTICFNYQICSSPWYHLIFCKYTNHQHTSLSYIFFSYSSVPCEDSDMAILMWAFSPSKETEKSFLRRNWSSSLFLAGLCTDTHCVFLFKCPSKLKEAEGSRALICWAMHLQITDLDPVEIWTKLFCFSVDWLWPGTQIHIVPCACDIV